MRVAPSQFVRLAGPQVFVTVMQGVLVTTVTQLDDVMVTDPHGPRPDAVRKSLIGPQVVRIFVKKTVVVPCAPSAPIVFVIVLMAPFTLMVSTTVTPVRIAEPQLLTKPETV